MLTKSRIALNRRALAFGAGLTLVLSGPVAAQADSGGTAVLHDRARSASGGHPPAHLRRRERRGLLGRRTVSSSPSRRLDRPTPATRSSLCRPTARRQRCSRPARARRPAPTSIPTASASSTPRPISRRPTVRRRPTARRATSGRSTAPTSSSPAAVQGGDLQQLTKNDAYDAEATICPVDGSIVFTSHP